MIAADLMTEHPRTIRPDDTIGEAIEALQSMDVRHLPVVNDDNELVGILSDRDLGSLFAPFAEGAEAEPTLVTRTERLVATIMHADVVTADAEADVADVIEAMLENKIGAIPVVDGERKLEGIISYVDILRTLGARESGLRALVAD